MGAMVLCPAMPANISRRSLLAGAGAVAAGPLVGQLFSVARAEEVAQAPQRQPGGICMSMLFEDDTKLKFDSDYYVKNHLPLLREVYGESVERIEMCAAAAHEGSISMVAMFAGIPAPRAVTTLWIRDVAAFGQKLAANADRINKDLSVVSSGNRMVQLNRVALELGDARSAITTETGVFSMYFRQFVHLPKNATGPSVKSINERADNAANAPPFDARLFLEDYVPKLFSAFPSFAVRRVEATLGLEQGGKKPAQLAAFHIFIRDRAAYDGTYADAFGKVKEESPKLQQSAVMMFSDMRVKAIG
jgi:hypothetical protein